jgi:hypothetical protein
MLFPEVLDWEIGENDDLRAMTSWNLEVSNDPIPFPCCAFVQSLFTVHQHPGYASKFPWG